MHLAYISNRSPERAALRGLALPIYEELGDLLGQANVLNNLGVDAYYEGRWQEALDHYDQSKALRERIGDVVGAATITNNIGEIKSDQGYLTTAAGLAEEAREVFATRRPPPAADACALEPRADRRARADELDDARRLLNEALEVAEEISSASLVDEVKTRLAEWAVLAREPEEALAGVEAALAAIRESGGGSLQNALAHRIRGYALEQLGRTRRGAAGVRAEPRARARRRRDLRARADARGDRRPEDARRRSTRRPRPPRRGACWRGSASSRRPWCPSSRISRDGRIRTAGLLLPKQAR